MNDEKNPLQLLLDEIIAFLGPLADENSDEQDILDFFSASGWKFRDIAYKAGTNAATVSGLVTNIAVDVKDIFTQVATELNNLNETGTPKDIVELVNRMEKVKDIINGVKKTVDGVQILINDPSKGLNDIKELTNVLPEFPEDLFNALTISWLLNHHRSTYFLLELLGFIQKQPEEFVAFKDGFVYRIKHQVPNLNFPAIGQFISDPRKYFLGIYFPENTFDNLDSVNTAAQFFFTRLGHFLASLDVNVELFGNLLPAKIKTFINDSAPGFEERLIKRAQGQLILEKSFIGFKDQEANNLEIIRFGIILGLLEKSAVGPGGVYMIPSGSISINHFFKKVNINWEFTASAIGLLFTKASVISLDSSSPTPTFKTNLGLQLLPDKDAGGKPMKILLWGSATHTRLDMETLVLSAGLDWSSSKQEIAVEMDIKSLQLVIKKDSFDGFIGKIFPGDGVEIEFDLGIGWTNLRGFYFHGSGALQYDLPINKVLFNVLTIGTLHLKLVFSDKEISPYITLDASATLGPVNAVIQDIGAKIQALFPEKGTGNGAGETTNKEFPKLLPGFKPPSGVGLSIDTPVIKAGGFVYFKPEEGEYFGALEIEIIPISLGIKAIGLINTKMPDGEGGFSLLIILTAEFMPIQLGFGFSLIGLGGLFGYNRTINTDRLRTGLHEGTLNSILFPKDVVANINHIITDIKEVFPIKRGKFVFGPMAKIAWGTPPIITGELGVIIELPDPVRIVIAGIVRANLPDPKTGILVLQIHFLGIIDFNEKLISFDAVLIDSKVLSMTLTGAFALRLGWGSPAIFILSAGGFHPDFKDAPPELMKMPRLGIFIIDSKDVQIWADSYFAVTTNTVQFGAHVHLFAQSGKYKAEAHAGFDALIQFHPFWFTASIGVSARVTGPAIDASIDINGTLSGPNPWHAAGSASLTILGIEVKIHLEATWGDGLPEVTVESTDVLVLLKQEAKKLSNWTAVAENVTGGKISLRAPDPASLDMILHPNSILAFSQRLVPLGIDIIKFGKTTIEGDINNFQFSFPKLNLSQQNPKEYDQEEKFVPDNFIEIPIGDNDKLGKVNLDLMPFLKAIKNNMNQAAKLAYPSFVDFKSGQTARMSDTTEKKEPDPGIPKEVKYEIIYRRGAILERKKDPEPLPVDLFGHLADGGAAPKSVMSQQRTQPSLLAPPVILRNKPEYNIVDENLAPKNKIPYKNHLTALIDHAKMNAEDQQKSLVISTFEL